MAIKTLAELYSYFETGDKPTQQQFRDLMDSYYHKNDGIAIADVAGLIAALNGKTDNATFLGNRMVSAADTAALAAISNANAGFVLVRQVGIFAPFNEGSIPGDVVTTYDSAVDGIVWGMVLDGSVFTISGEYDNNTAALVGGLLVNQIYSLPISDDISHLAVVKQPVPNFDIEAMDWGANGVTNEASFVTFLESKGATDVHLFNFSLIDNRLKCYVVCNDLVNCTLDNLGIISVYAFQIPGVQILSLTYNNIEVFNPEIPLSSSITSLELSHNNIENFNPTIPLPALFYLGITYNQLTGFDMDNEFPETLSEFNLANNNITSFDPFRPFPTSLTILNLSNNALSEFNPYNALPGYFRTLILDNNEIVDFSPSITWPTIQFELLSLFGNNITTFNPSNALPDCLKSLYLNSNQLTSFSPTHPLPLFLEQLYFAQNLLTVSEVNAVLAYWNSNTKSSPFHLTLNQNVTASPSGAGITDKAALISRGCVISTD